jgi:hypothetical protein
MFLNEVFFKRKPEIVRERAPGHVNDRLLPGKKLIVQVARHEAVPRVIPV